MEESASIKTIRKKVGRPRTLTLEEILDTALRMGLSEVSMPALARELGVGTATLYNYVSNRADLLHRATLRRAAQPILDDGNRNWQSLVRYYAKCSMDFWASEPQLVVQFMHGAIGPEVMPDFLESLLAALAKRGFSPENAFRVLSAVHTVVFGAAVRAHYLQSPEMRDEGQKSSLSLALRFRGQDEFPHLRDALTVESSIRPDFHFKNMVELLIAGIEAEIAGRAHPRDARGWPAP